MHIHQVNLATVLEMPRLFKKAQCQAWLTQAEDAGFCTQNFHGGETRERAQFDDPAMAQDIWSCLPSLPELASLYGAELRPEPDVVSLTNHEAVGLNARMRFYRYRHGARFSRHHDLSYESTLRSFLTVLIYLSDDMEGGQTDFDGGLSIAPQMGSCVIFPHELMHQGMPVVRGTKIVLRTDVMYRQVYTHSKNGL